jgi:phage baseplate assembly protein W
MATSATTTNLTIMGFSTQADTLTTKKFTLYNIDLVKQDLLNQFFTRKGERVMLPNYGTIIWDKLFEILNNGSRQEIIDDATRIVKSDPRVSLISINIFDIDHGITIVMEMWYAPLAMTTTLSVNFDTQAQTRNTTGV